MRVKTYGHVWVFQSLAWWFWRFSNGYLFRKSLNYGDVGSAKAQLKRTFSGRKNFREL